MGRVTRNMTRGRQGIRTNLKGYIEQELRDGKNRKKLFPLPQLSPWLIVKRN